MKNININNNNIVNNLTEVKDNVDQLYKKMDVLNNSISDALVKIYTNLQSLVSNLDDIHIISSYSFSNFPHKKNIKKTLNFSIKLYKGKIYIESIWSNLLSYRLDVDRICIILVFPLPIKESSSEEYKINIHGKEIGLFIKRISIDRFFKQIEDLSKFTSTLELGDEIVGVNPIVIFHNISWGSILYIARLYGYVIHGGTSTNRHKLSLTEYKLSYFLQMSGLLNNKSQYYTDYVEKEISGNKNIEVEFNHPMKHWENIMLDYIGRDKDKDKILSFYLYWMKRSTLIVQAFIFEKEKLQNLFIKIEDIENLIFYMSKNLNNLYREIELLSKKVSVIGIPDKKKANIIERHKILSQERVYLNSEVNRLKREHQKFIIDLNRSLTKLNREHSLGIKFLNKLENFLEDSFNNIEEGGTKSLFNSLQNVDS